MYEAHWNSIAENMQNKFFLNISSFTPFSLLAFYTETESS